MSYKYLCYCEIDDKLYKGFGCVFLYEKEFFRFLHLDMPSIKNGNDYLLQTSETAVAGTWKDIYSFQKGRLPHFLEHLQAMNLKIYMYSGSHSSNILNDSDRDLINRNSSLLREMCQLP